MDAPAAHSGKMARARGPCQPDTILLNLPGGRMRGCEALAKSSVSGCALPSAPATLVSSNLSTLSRRSPRVAEAPAASPKRAEKSGWPPSFSSARVALAKREGNLATGPRTDGQWVAALGCHKSSQGALPKAADGRDGLGLGAESEHIGPASRPAVEATQPGLREAPRRHVQLVLIGHLDDLRRGT